MKERGILFSGDMVRAILNGKTQTRRPIKPQPRETSEWLDVDPRCNLDWKSSYCGLDYIKSRCPFGQPGDRLWVRETWLNIGGNITYKANFDGLSPWDGMWKPSIHMPRRASRILLEVDEVRIERVQDITIDDIRAEGIQQRFPKVNDQFTPDILRGQFLELWDSINSKRGYGWNVNPYVWVVKFHKSGSRELLKNKRGGESGDY